MWGKSFKGFEDFSVKIDCDSRPVIARCKRCGLRLRGRTRTISADQAYYISGHVMCKPCALEEFERLYSLSDVL